MLRLNQTICCPFQGPHRRPAETQSGCFCRGIDVVTRIGRQPCPNRAAISLYRPSQPPPGPPRPPLGLLRPPLGLLRPPLGLLRPPLGLLRPPLGLLRPPLGLLRPPLGLLRPPLGLLRSPPGPPFDPDFLSSDIAFLPFARSYFANGDSDPACLRSCSFATAMLLSGVILHQPLELDLPAQGREIRVGRK